MVRHVTFATSGVAVCRLIHDPVDAGSIWIVPFKTLFFVSLHFGVYIVNEKMVLDILPLFSFPVSCSWSTEYGLKPPIRQ